MFAEVDVPKCTEVDQCTEVDVPRCKLNKKKIKKIFLKKTKGGATFFLFFFACTQVLLRPIVLKFAPYMQVGMAHNMLERNFFEKYCYFLLFFLLSLLYVRVSRIRNVSNSAVFRKEKKIFLRLPVYKNMRILFIFWLANGAKYEKTLH